MPVSVHIESDGTAGFLDWQGPLEHIDWEEYRIANGFVAVAYRRATELGKVAAHTRIGLVWAMWRFQRTESEPCAPHQGGEQ